MIGGEGKKYFYHNDHLPGLAVTDEQGNKVVERDFTPFGERINVDIYDETNRDPAEMIPALRARIGMPMLNCITLTPGGMMWDSQFISQDQRDDPRFTFMGLTTP